MSQPTSFVDSRHTTHVCKLHKVLYGLRQSLRAWYHKLSETLLSLGFFPSLFDPSLFQYRKGSDIIFILVYIDDVILTGNNTTLLQ
jgi:Reverse transcriptase (RNA-dependent DNA polymerase)